MAEIMLKPKVEVAPIGEALADSSPGRRILDRYMKQINAMFVDADENSSHQVLVDVLPWSLAKIPFYAESRGVAGDTVRRLGVHMCDFTLREQARVEAEKARDGGMRHH